MSDDIQETFAHVCAFFGITPEDESGSKDEQCDEESEDINVDVAVNVIEYSCEAQKAVLKEERSMLDSMEQALEKEDTAMKP